MVVEPTNINWHRVRDEAVRHLRTLVRIDTSNPPGNELAAAEYLAGVLATDGLSPLVLESAPGRGSMIARLPGTGDQPPLMIMGHLDVVPAVAEEWTHPPFGGDLIDGFVWGRGTLDCKNLVVADLMIVLLFHRLSLPLKGDLVMLAHADEESSDFADGISWLTREHRALLDAPYALYEGGGEAIEIAGKPIRTVITGEKGWCTVGVTTRGQGGHSSIPHANNPLFHMAPILSRLRTTHMPIHISDTTAGFLQGLSDCFEPDQPEMAHLFRQMIDPTEAELSLERLSLACSQRDWLNALVRNTVAPTMIQGSSSPWALPSEAHLTLNGRIVPGQRAGDFERELRSVLGADTEYRIEGLHLGIDGETDSPVFRSIRGVMRRRSPGVPVVPCMAAFSTERALLAGCGMQTYGFVPRRAEPSVPTFEALAHGADERISVDNLLYSIQCLFEIVCDLNGVSTDHLMHA